MSFAAALRSLLSRGQRSQPPIPPPDLIERVGAGDFVAVGNEFLRLCVGPGGLRKSDRVLDVGCGAGRMAAPLMRYLTSGRYDGFDVSAAAISWCKSNLEPLNPRFHFQHVDVRNDVFNPEGSVDPSSFRFPYADDAFDFVLLASVFTHLFADETTRYLHEIARVLRRGGRMLATFFLLDDEAIQAVERGVLPFTHACDHGAFAYPERPGKAVAFYPGWVQSQIANAGMHLEEPIHYGSWCKRPTALTYQDLVVAKKQAAAVRKITTRLKQPGSMPVGG